MAARDNFHSRLVAWMKIILPLAALGLLSTLFLISRGFDPARPPQGASIDLERRAHEQGATQAAFAGMTTGGDEVTLQAQTAHPDPSDPRTVNARDVTARLQLVRGGIVDIASQRANMQQAEQSATLLEDVEIETATGYVLRTQRLDTRFDRLFAQSPGAVTGHGPPGDLSAGQMVLQNDPVTGAPHLRFTSGVKLIYMPQISKD